MCAKLDSKVVGSTSFHHNDSISDNDNDRCDIRLVSNDALSSCRAKLNLARLKRDFSTTVGSNVGQCLVVPSNTRALWTQIIFGKRSYE